MKLPLPHLVRLERVSPESPSSSTEVAGARVRHSYLLHAKGAAIRWRLLVFTILMRMG